MYDLKQKNITSGTVDHELIITFEGETTDVNLCNTEFQLKLNFILKMRQLKG